MSTVSIKGLLFAGFGLGTSSFASAARVEGRVSGFTEIKKHDKIIDGAVVLRPLSAKSFMLLDVNSFLVGQDKIKVGPIKSMIPSNVCIPTQRERKLISLKIEKNSFRLDVPQNEADQFYALSFKAPFEGIIKERDSQWHEIVKFLDWQKYGELSATSQRGALDISLNQYLKQNTLVQWMPTQQKRMVPLLVKAKNTLNQKWSVVDLRIVEKNKNQYMLNQVNSRKFNGREVVVAAQVTHKKDGEVASIVAEVLIGNAGDNYQFQSQLPSKIKVFNYDESNGSLNWEMKGDVNGFVGIVKMTLDKDLSESGKPFYTSELISFSRARTLQNVNLNQLIKKDQKFSLVYYEVEDGNIELPRTDADFENLISSVSQIHVVQN